MDPTVSTKKTQRLGRKYRMSAADFKAVAHGVRELYKALRAENPQWTHRDTEMYMYENDDAFKDFQTKQPSASRLVIDLSHSDADIDRLCAALAGFQAGIIAPAEVLAAVKG